MASQVYWLDSQEQFQKNDIWINISLQGLSQEVAYS
jgi:hypothetical protein